MINIKPFNYNYEFITIAKPLGKSITLKAGETVRAEVIDILPSGGVVLKTKGSYITVNTEIPLQKDTSLLLKILNTPQTDHKLKIQIIAVLNKNGTVNVNPTAQLTTEQLSQFLKTETVQKSFIENIVKLIPQKIENLEPHTKLTLINLLQNSIKSDKIIPEILKNIPYLQNLLVQVKDITPEKLQLALLNSGILFETKLKNKEKEIKNDLKFKLLQNVSGKDNAEIQNLLKTVENYQLLSRLAEGIYTFLPVIWKDLERGDILITKKEKKGKKSYLCNIDLNFSDLGNIQILLLLNEKDLLVTFYIENSKFREFIENQVKILKESLQSSSFGNIFVKFPREKRENLEIYSSENLLHLKI
ncbi:hypothetical protein [Persephonella sp.]